MRRVVVSALEERRCEVLEVPDLSSLHMALAQEPSLLILDAVLGAPRLPELLDRLRTEHPDLAVIVTSYRESLQEAMEARQHGAVEYLAKPFRVEQLEAAVDKALGDPQHASTPLLEQDWRHLRLEAFPSVQRNPLMKKAVGLLNSVAKTDITVLICGESGVGKEVFAQSLHQRSMRQQHRFIELNCASVPATLLESELFGSERGAFTGSVSTRVGKFELAQRGTILLDEVSEMDVSLQAKLLRVIQEKALYRIGGDRKIPLNVRIVATTNRDLRQWVKQGHFREDLFYRLNVIALHVPPLRERREDIPVLAQFIVDRFNRENKKHFILTMEAIEQLCRYDWPGNVRELENILFLTAFLTPGRKITKIHFDDGNPYVVPESEEVPEVAAALEEPSLEVPVAGSVALSGTIEDMERDMIRRALQQFTGNRTHAANALGISVRTLRNKLRLYPDLDPFAGQNVKIGRDVPSTDCH
ncbi:MAG: sigma-54-dependent Fis family transcriptional regulator [Deltaproteobacteria bacterium]|nr:sigma-54-dependent Fis family transcriptional regulator [Deltaproteobacteria bacterium]